MRGVPPVFTSGFSPTVEPVSISATTEREEGCRSPPRSVLIALLWLTLGISVGMVDHQGMHVLLALVALGVPVLVLSVPTLRDK